MYMGEYTHGVLGFGATYTLLSYSIGRKNYGGMGLKVKFKAISNLDISFIDPA